MLKFVKLLRWEIFPVYGGDWELRIYSDKIDDYSYKVIATYKTVGGALRAISEELLTAKERKINPYLPNKSNKLSKIATCKGNFTKGALTPPNSTESRVNAQ